MSRTWRWLRQLPAAGCRLRPVAPLVVLALACRVGAAPASEAALVPLSHGWLQIETSLTVTPEMIESRWTSLVRRPNSRPDYLLADTGSPSLWGSLRDTPSFIEMTPVRTPGSAAPVYVRPQFALGSSSLALRGWLRQAGIEAASCTAPLMKMHSSFAGSNARANVSLSARCSVH